VPHCFVEKSARALNEHAKPVRGSRVAIVGVSYKSGVGDLRESPALKIMRLLRQQGAEVLYHDDYVPELPDLRCARSGPRTPTGRRS
jgi:UDP-N-acetyl-D-glucosamine dehydrogenase